MKDSLIRFALYLVCAAAGGLAVYLPDGPVQQGADMVAQQCEASGLQAYPRTVDGGVQKRLPEEPGRRVGLLERGGSMVPTYLPPAAGTSTVSDVGPAQ